MADLTPPENCFLVDGKGPEVSCGQVDEADGFAGLARLSAQCRVSGASAMDMPSDR
jgi:hypothetical protein